MQNQKNKTGRYRKLIKGYKSAAICLSLMIIFITGCFPNDPGNTNNNTDYTGIKTVLFIGHSYTFWNDMPFMFQQMTIDAGEDTVIAASTYTDGGASLMRFWNYDYSREELLRIILQGNFDYVFMQGIIIEGDDIGKYAKLFAEEIDVTGARKVLYLPWTVEGSSEYQETINAGYYAVADSIDAIVAPVGIGWHRSISENPQIDLYDYDRSHPSEAGSYFAACVFYSVLYNKSPEGLPSDISYFGRRLINLAPEVASELQRVAWETVQEMNSKK